MRMHVVSIALLCACSKSADKAKPASEGPERISNHALAATPLQSFAGKAGTVAFTIDLPVTELKSAELDAERAYATWEVKRGWFDTPTFTVQLSDMPVSPDYTGASEPFGDDAKDRKITRAEKLSDGGYLNLDERTDHAFYVLEVCRPSGPNRLCCRVTQRGDKPLEGYAEILAFAEKVCRSMKPS